MEINGHGLSQRRNTFKFLISSHKNQADMAFMILSTILIYQNMFMFGDVNSLAVGLS